MKQPNYGTPAKPDRDAALIRDYLAGPTTIKAMGDKYGISRERARQILAKHGVTFRHPPPEKRNRFDHGAIAERYRTTSLTTGQVAREFGCCGSTVGVALKEHGIQWDIGRSHQPAITDLELAAEMYESGTTCEQIGTHFDCSAATAAKSLRRRGVEMRRRGRRRRAPVPWAQHEIDSMLAMWRDGMTQTAIARKLGRCQANVSERLARLRKEGVVM